MTGAPRGAILVVGDLVTDVVAVVSGAILQGTDTAAKISMTGGGSAANTAAWLVRAGVPVTLAAAVGDDPAGAQRVAELEAVGVSCAAARHPGATGTVVVLATRDERSMIADRGANARLAPADIDAALRRRGEHAHLHLSGYPLFDERSRPAGRHALATARAAGLSVSVDAASAAPLRQLGPENFLEWTRGADLIFANVEEARALVGDRAGGDLAPALAAAADASVAIVKQGADGAVWASCDGVTTRTTAAPARVADVTGAGDAFAAGALHGYLAGQPPQQVLASAVALAAEAVSQVGARPTRW